MGSLYFVKKKATIDAPFREGYYRPYHIRIMPSRKESTLNGGQPPSGKIDLFSSWSGRRFPEGVYIDWWSTTFRED